MAQNRFRKDLYYRLRGGWLHLPPLRERKDDIPLLITRFIKEFCGSSGIPIERDALAILMAYDYPGNIRELKAVIQSSVNLAHTGAIAPKHLSENMRKLKLTPKSPDGFSADTIATLDQIQKKHILSVYEQMGHNKSRTARLLGIGLNTLRRKLESYGVS